MNIQLEKIIPKNDQIDRLFELLKKRINKISHEQLPLFKDHNKFVKNNPYRGWFIITRKKIDIGNIYIQYDNSVGLNFTDDLIAAEIDEIIKNIYSKMKPLKAIPSVRYKDYFFNVATSNLNLQKKLLNIGYSETQRSYIYTNSVREKKK